MEKYLRGDPLPTPQKPILLFCGTPDPIPARGSAAGGRNVPLTTRQPIRQLNPQITNFGDMDGNDECANLRARAYTVPRAYLRKPDNGALPGVKLQNGKVELWVGNLSSISAVYEGLTRGLGLARRYSFVLEGIGR